ncbi:hypothetical protein NBRC3293_2855 [Gluconobacter oxydans NBRC 3293]|uniref:Uncharacterized protein n=2 Tax=Gluconobacter oxydans TaxID=442 RepID=A0A829WNF7_GLUOY|nr:hypothetical protein GLS_c01730 [Gluconobacter oxydans DSM 3504]GEM18358.1 hypothetical protein NBRC3293_2855 [Gluconobacter oxydans NBRC 3293]
MIVPPSGGQNPAYRPSGTLWKNLFFPVIVPLPEEEQKQNK